MKLGSRLGWAAVVAVFALLVAGAVRVERRLGLGGSGARLVFDVHASGARPPTSPDAIIDAWQRRLSGRAVRIERSDRSGRVTVSVEGTAAEAELVRGLLTRGGRLDFYVVENDTPTAKAWFQQVRRQPPADGIDAMADSWTNDKNGEVFNDYFLKAPTVDALEAALAQLEPPPAELRVLYEQVFPPERAKDNRPYLRTYLVDATAELGGGDIESAKIVFDPNTLRPEVIIHFTRDGGRRFGDLTGRMVGKKLAIVLDGVVQSAPIVQTAIRGGSCTISMGGADERQLEADASALVGVLKTGAQLPEGLTAGLVAAHPADRSSPWPIRVLLALLAGAGAFLLLPRLARLVVVGAAVPLARGSRGLPKVALAAALTIGLPLVLQWLAGSPHLLIPGVNRHELASVVDFTPGFLGHWSGYERMNVFTLGVLPIVSGFWIVEAIAALIPRWSRRRLATAAERRRLDVAALATGLGLALIQGYFVAQFLASLSGRGTSIFEGGMGPSALVTLSLAAGVAIHVLAARVITRHGLCNGYLALLGVGAARGVWGQLAHPAYPGAPADRLALAACLAAIALVAIVVTALRDRPPSSARQPWPVLTAVVGLGEAVGLVMVLAQLFAGLDPIRLTRLLVQRPLWFDALFAVAAVAVVVRWQRIAVTRLGLATAGAVLATLLGLRWLAPPSFAIATLILPAIYATFVVLESIAAIRARLGMAAPVVVLAVHDVERADRAADALAAAGIPASVENRRFRALLRGLAGYAPIVARVTAADADRATAAIATAEAEAGEPVATFFA